MVAAPGNAGFGAAVVSRRAAFRRWRRACPFWGGFLLLLAGIELLLIPLSGIFIHGAVKLVVYIGIGGVFGVLLGVLLIACGLLLWLNPAHRTFYAIAGVLHAVLSFIASNLGGFFIGMLLGIVGGSMGFGWTPAADQPPPSRPRLARAAHHSRARPLGRPRASGPSPRPPLAHAASKHPPRRRSSSRAPPPWTACRTSTTQVPTASGTVTMMKFTMSSLTLTGGVRATVTQDGQATVTDDSSLDFSGGAVLYATELSGRLLGIPIRLTPGNAVTVLLKLLNSLTPLVPVTMTNVTTDDFLVASDSLQANDLTVTSG